MALYGSIYQFSIVSQNGDDVDIFIMKKNYTGVAQQRPLGRAPILKRERNGNILGTSLEIFAECRIDGEFAQLYTSSADEFLVEVYRNQLLQWTGFVSPELYSEPDIAPPYDVQIIATDGLGELKSYDFVQGARSRSFLGHLNSMLAHTSLDLGVETVSELQYYDDGWTGNTGIMSVVTDMSHKENENCYDVLQSMLASVNAVITQQAGRWMVLRESDLYALADSLNPVVFGSMVDHEWWPVGNLSTDIIPAKKSLSLTCENHYKNSVLGNSLMNGDTAWEKELNALYDVAEGGYRLPVSGSTIRQKVDFYAEVGYRLLLHISARNVGDIEDPQKLGVIVKIDGRMYQTGSEFWLHAREGDEDKYIWANTEKYIEVDLPASSVSDTRSDAQDIDIVIPLYKYDSRSYAYATAVDVTLFNVSGNAGIAVYECSLSQYDRSAGNKIAVAIGNGAREDAGNTELAFSDGEYALSAADVARYAVPLGYDSEVIIKKWRTPAINESAYLPVMARDYAMQVALPRMRYRGKLNVPSMTDPVIPIIFEHDSTYYFLNTYSYDLLHDELEVELISIPNASVTIESETVTELPSAGSASGAGSSGGGGTSGGGGGGSSTLSGLADVQVSNVKEGQYLVYKEGYWKAESVGESVVSEVNDALNSMRLASNAFKNQGLAYSYDSNMYYENASLDSTDFIRIGERIKGRMFLGGPEYPRYSIIFFDAYKNIISRYTGDSGKAELQDFDLTWQIPADAEFIVATNYNEYREVSYILFDGYEYAREIEAINEKTQVIPSIINNLGDCVIGEAVAPANDNLSFGIKCNAGKVKVSVSVQNGSISGDKRWFIYRYANGQFEGTALGSITPPNTSLVVNVPEGDDGVWLFRGKETASYKVGYTVLSRLNLTVPELADEIVSLENKNELMQADIQEIKEDIEVIPELQNEILAITGYLGQIKATSIKNRISLWIDSVPEVPSYQIRVTSNGSPVNDFNIYKAASDRTGLEIIYKDAGFDTWFTIERDDNKPVLYIYNARVTEGSGSAVEYTFDFRAADSLVQDVEKLKNQDNSLSWKGISIVCFGDSLTEFLDYTNGKSYPDYIKDLTGAEVYNLGIGGSNFRQRSTPVNNPTNYKDAYAALDIVNMVKASCEQNFTKQINAANFLTTDQGDNNEAIVARMQTIDWSKVNVVTIFAGTNDWNNSNSESFGELSSTDINTTFGAIKEIIRLLLTTYPHIRIYWFSPTVRWLTDDNGARTDATWSDVFERFGYTLEEFSDAILSVVKRFHLPMCDMYNTLGWNQYNFSQFFSETDGVHPRVGEGTIQIAKKMIAFINSNKTF